MNELNVSYEEVEDVVVGDIFSIRGKRYKLLKRTTTAISVVRWHWYDDVTVWMQKKLKIGDGQW